MDKTTSANVPGRPAATPLSKTASAALKTLGIDQCASVEQIREELAVREARKSYYKYVLYSNQGFIDTAFHRFLCNKVQEFLNKKGSAAFDVLLISTPPQHGKSRSLTETLPSWYLGNHPDKSVIIAGYSEDFAKRFGRRNLRKLEDYGPRLFPDFHPAEAPWTNTEFESVEGGRCISRGILSGITGNPADLFIIDDPTKNMQEAMSETTRAAILDEFYASILTRIAPHGKIIVIQTRWHEDDLFGHIKRTFQNVEVLNLPCEAEENDPMGRPVGAPLCPEIGKGAAWLKDYKTTYVTENGERAWNALFQGNPVLNSGNIFLKENWQFYEDLPEQVYNVLSVDAAFKKSETSDFVAIQHWGKRANDYYGIWGTRRRLSFTEMITVLREYISSHPDLDAVYIEDKANGSAAIDMLSQEFDNIIPVNPEGGKLSRAAAVSYIQETKHVYLPYEPWAYELVDEAAAFPAGQHDDTVDAFTQALNRLSIIGAPVSEKVTREYSVWTPDMYQDFEAADDALKSQLLKEWKYPVEWR